MQSRSIRENDILSVVQLISEAMNEDEGRWAATTIKRHFVLRNLGIDDGRKYLVFESAGHVVGISGIHHYEWGPPEHVWLGWFALDPAMRGQGYGAEMMTVTEDLARQQGYRKLFIETYQSETFQGAIKFYEKHSFSLVGSIRGYLPDGSDMLVFSKKI
jgi:GNAT superfamily N-acetyltransferase